MSLSNPAAITAADARQMLGADAWRAYNGNGYVRQAISKRKKHCSIRVSHDILLEDQFDHFVEFAQELGYKVRVYNNKSSRRITLRWK